MHNAYADIRRHTFADVLREHRRSRPGLLAAIDGGLRLTWAELDARVNRLAGSLMARGVVSGDRVLWLGQNSVKLFELVLAAAKIGALVCPANWRMTADEIRWAVEDFDPKVVFWQEAEIGAPHRGGDTAWSADRIWCQHDGDQHAEGGHDCFDAWIEASADIDPQIMVDPQSPLLAIYTAAFDGKPGAALLSHDAILLQSVISAQGQAINEASRYLVSGPMFHLGVLMGAFATYVVGGALAFVARVDAAEILGLVDAERVTHGFLPQPTVLQMKDLNPDGRYDIACLFKDGDVANWRSPLVMPAHAPMTLKPGGYGQTEIMGLSILAWFGGSGAGRPNPFTQVMILDDAGAEAATGAAGEIAVRGAMVMSGYWNRPDENIARTADGWHRTRDLGRRNEDGSIVFIGPKVSMIKSGVENIYPAEVEACLMGHPAVGGVCVIGVPDPKWDQNVKAVVMLKPGQAATPDDLIEHCRSRMASYKKPKVVEFVDALPRLPIGAVDRAAVDAAHGGGGYPSAGVR
ncbi:MAG: acyl-CoA synthetase [Caulobacter sp.]|nr:acyl-CoA synthetase [Caulobacter sp.]